MNAIWVENSSPVANELERVMVEQSNELAFSNMKHRALLERLHNLTWWQRVVVVFKPERLWSV